MNEYSKIERLKQNLKYFVFEKKFNGPGLGILSLLLIPLVAYPQTLSDYENTATVTASPDQFETITTNNSSSVQVTPNAEIVIVKQVVNDDGGTLSLADFSVASSAGALTFDAGVSVGSTTTFTSDKLYIVPGSFTLSEADVTGYTEGLWSCTAGVLSRNAFDDGEILLAAGESAICTIVNDDAAPTLTLVKNVVNDNGGALLVSDFALTLGAGPAISGVTQTVAANTDITISEIEVAGYSAAGGWSCSDANNITQTLPSAGAAAGVDVNLLPGSDVTCEITNDDAEATLTLVKNVVNDNGGALLVGDFALTLGAGPASSGVTQTVVANTNITIGEVEVAGYSAAGGWSCIDANNITQTLPSAGAAAGVDVNLLPGSDVTCSIVNDDVEPTLTLVKNVVNDNGGGLLVSDFALTLGAGPAISGVTQTVAANTDITIGEVEVAGYSAAGGWSCSDANNITQTLPSAGAAAGVDVNLLPGSDVTCSIVNDDVEPTLTLVKNVVNDNGGALLVSDFALTLGAGPAISGVAQTVAANTDVTIGEVEVAGYSAAGGWSCKDANNITQTLPSAGAAAGVDVNLLPGSDVTCSIVNDDIEPTLTLVKNVVNDNGGALLVSDFALTLGAGPAISGVTQTVAANTDITISEIEVAGYSAAGGWSCSDANNITQTLPSAGAAAGVDVNLLPGSDVTCEITNDDAEATLTLVKNVVNDNGGALLVSDFALTLGAGPAVSGVAQTVAANTDITIGEVEVAGYSAAGGWSCSDANNITQTLPSAGAAAGVDVNLLPGSDVTCEITNDDAEATLTLVKNVVNDNGGALLVSDFALTLGAGPAISGVAQTVAANTNVTIGELEVAGYSAAGGWSCKDANNITQTLPSAGAAAGVDVNLLPGSDVTCSIINDDIEPTLTLVKNVVNDNGGALQVSDFALTLGTGPAISGVTQAVAANTDITIGEVEVIGYSAAGGWSCIDANNITQALPSAGAAAGVDVNLLPGSDVTCEITNDDLGIDLSIAKVVSNSTPNIGDTITFTLTVDNAGPDVATNATVSDVVLSGFTYVPGSITGGTSSSDTDPTGAGLNWTLASVPVGSPVVLTFDVTVNAP